MNRTEMKREAQGELMYGIGNVLGYWEEDESKWPKGWEDWTEEKRNAYRDIMQREADRIARMFGYEAAWSN